MDVSGVNLVIQWVGSLVVLGLLLFLTRSFRQRSLFYWAVAWCCLVLSLLALQVAFRVPALQGACLPLYYLGEYAFGYLLLAGCRHLATGRALDREAGWLLLAGLAVALLLPRLSSDFNAQFIPHAAILSGLFLAGSRALKPVRARQRGPGVKVMNVALLALAVDFGLYVPVFAVAVWRGSNRRFPYLDYNSIVDLILETVLAFGIVMLITDALREEAEEANLQLKDALSRLEMLARTDPLTSALNRHAFEALLAGEVGGRRVPGSAAIVDVDNLKAINDSLGHAAGDLAIRGVASAIRSVIRADDGLFRLGGDEFLVVMQGLPEAEARRRLGRLDAALRDHCFGDREIPVSVSVGVAEFGDATRLEQALETADRRMYADKQSRR
ncbi:MAG TPA: GGDEF domain-containing protein [Thermoanaerobaculia bacterium]|nr:GGDEF domain-containing protein [Thermoanaerobaculia bacterium]